MLSFLPFIFIQDCFHYAQENTLVCGFLCLAKELRNSPLYNVESSVDTGSGIIQSINLVLLKQTNSVGRLLNSFFFYLKKKFFFFSYRLYTRERLNNRSAETGKHQVHNKEIQLSKENLEFLKSYSYCAPRDLNYCLSFNRRVRNLQSVTLKLCKGLAFNLKMCLTCLKNYVKYSSSNGNNFIRQRNYFTRDKVLQL